MVKVVPVVLLTLLVLVSLATSMEFNFQLITRAVDQQISTVNSLCNNEPPEQCLCSLSNAPASSISLETYTLRDLALCRPKVCICDNGDQVDVPAPNLPATPLALQRVAADHVARLNNLCSEVGSQLEMCVCNFRKGSSIVPPIQLEDLGLCLPSLCTCVDGTELPVPTPNFGLANEQ